MRKTWLLAVCCLGSLGCATPATAQSFSLGTAQSFAVLGASTVTNTGPSVIDGDLGLSPGTSVTGFPPGIVNGTMHITNAVALQAQADALTSYNVLAGMAPTQNLSGQDLGGMTLLPGVYKFDSAAQLTGALTLNSLGNPDSLFVFQIGSALTTASASSVLNINGGNDCNIFWQIGSSATLGTTTAFKGSVLANQSVTLNTGATMLAGRAIALNGAVTLDTNHISIAGCPTVDAPAGTFVVTQAVPEPGSIALMLAGLGVPLAGLRRRKR